MSEYIHKSHNVSVLLYHYVCPAKYRRKIFTEKVDKTLRDVCIEISERYEINFIEIGTDGDHVHFLIQSVPTLSPTKIITILNGRTKLVIQFLYIIMNVKINFYGGYVNENIRKH